MKCEATASDLPGPTSDPQLRFQFNRIAHDTRRFHWLGPLRFFDTIEAAQTYIQG